MRKILKVLRALQHDYLRKLQDGVTVRTELFTGDTSDDNRSPGHVIIGASP